MAWHVAQMGEIISAYRNVIVIPGGKRPSMISRLR
jgi:hypothetical protein